MLVKLLIIVLVSLIHAVLRLYSFFRFATDIVDQA